MNCRRVEKLIPLYVEGDLAPGIADRLTSHLDWCGRCNWLADEYRESQGWLRTSEPPEFDEALLDNLKAGVLSRIEETSARPSLLASLVQQWSRRQVLALSAALLIIFGALVFYIYQSLKGRTTRRIARARRQTKRDRMVAQKRLQEPVWAGGIITRALQPPSREVETRQARSTHSRRGLCLRRTGWEIQRLPQRSRQFCFRAAAMIRRKCFESRFKPAIQTFASFGSRRRKLKVRNQTSERKNRRSYVSQKQNRDRRFNRLIARDDSCICADGLWSRSQDSRSVANGSFQRP